MHGLGGEDKVGTEGWERLRGFGGKKKMALKKREFFADGRTENAHKRYS